MRKRRSNSHCFYKCQRSVEVERKLQFMNNKKNKKQSPSEALDVLGISVQSCEQVFGVSKVSRLFKTISLLLIFELYS